MEWLQRINTMAQHRQHAKVVDLDQIDCQLNNQHGYTMPLMSIERNQFVCQYQAHCFALCMCCDFFACDCRMRCPEGCTCYHDSTWSANVIQCSLRGHTDIPPLIPMDATSIFLDGNNFTGTLESQAFIGRKRVTSMYLNSSQIAAISNQTFNGLTELEILHLEDNLMQRLEGYEFGNLTSLKELYLERNQLVYINDLAFSALASLELLHLHDNMLAAYPAWELSRLLPSLTTVTLSGNPWSCQCKFVYKLTMFAKQDGQVADLQQIACRDSKAAKTLYLGENITCTDASVAVTLGAHQTFEMNVIPIALSVAAAVVVLAVTVVILFVFRTPLKVWLHSKYGVRVMSTDGGTKDKLYDAFVSYSLKDDDFVHQILVPQLEHPSLQLGLPTGANYRLCLEHRDLPQSSSIADAFPGVSQLCAKHLLVVSRAYLESEWPQIKFAVKDFKKWRPVIILLEELMPLDLAAVPEFNLLLKAGAVLRWSDAGFWNKLRFYLPDPTMRSSTFKTLVPDQSQQGTPKRLQNDIAASVGGYLQHQAPQPVVTTSSAWQYEEGLLMTNSNDSSQASTRSTIAGGSPRTVIQGPSGSSASSSTNSSQPSAEMVQVVSNPLDTIPEPAYQTVHQSLQGQEHIYHSLDDHAPGYSGYDTLGKLDVMLPNGQMVPATLVRNVSGRIVPLVDVDSKTLNYTPESHRRNNRGSNRHFLWKEHILFFKKGCETHLIFPITFCVLKNMLQTKI